MTLLGPLSLWLAFLVGLWGAITGFAGGAQGRVDLQRSARHATSALFAGQKGSLLFWATVLSLFASLVQLLTSRRHRVYLPYVAAVTCLVATFFISVMLFAANPFERLGFVPIDGRGMNPQLQNPGMVFHPPMLYLGYISITIPFAFAIAALLSRKLDAEWLVAVRKWTLVSWLFLSVHFRTATSHSASSFFVSNAA